MDGNGSVFAISYDGDTLHGVKVVSLRPDLSAYCLLEAEIDSNVDFLVGELENARAAMKEWLKFRPRASTFGDENA